MEGNFRVGPWLVQPSLNSVSRGGPSVHLTPKVMEVLVCLAERAGEPVSKETLLQKIWPDTFVSEDVLKGSISELRRVFEDDAKEPHVIQTIAKRGYRLIARIEPVNEIAGESSNSRNPTTRTTVGMTANKLWTRALFVGGAALVFLLLGAFNVGGFRTRFVGKSSAPQIRSLAVLPLQNLSADPAQEYFSDGLTSALITDLAQIGSVKVISRTSSMQYKQTKKSLPEIARELNVDGIVEGTVQRSGDRVRITAQLILGASDKHLWANSYEREIRDVFALERDVTHDIANEVQSWIDAQRQPSPVQPRQVNLNALDAYLQGNYHLQKADMGKQDEELRKAGEYFQRSINADPLFVRAYIGLAEAHHNVLWPSSEDFEIFKSAAERALKLAPGSSEARTEVALTKWEQWDWIGAEEEFRKAITLNPNNALAHNGLGDCLDSMGHLEEGWKENELAQELDPTSDHLLWALYRRGEYDRAIKLIRTALQTRPDDVPLHWLLSETYAQKGMYKEWVEELSEMLTLSGYVEAADHLQHVFATSGYWGARQFWARELEQAAASKQNYFPGVLAQVYAALGDRQRAFYWLSEGVDHHAKAISDPVLEWTKIDPGLASLHSDPRFADLVRRMGLPP